jgi:hypothetical protein
LSVSLVKCCFVRPPSVGETPSASRRLSPQLRSVVDADRQIESAFGTSW